jgi:multidrug efflux pump subunit AcrA (membrane-fusion protein)
VPNAALRFQAVTEAESGPDISLFRGRRDATEQEVTIGRGARQTLYALDEDGALTEVPVVVGNTDGAWTIVSGETLKTGMPIVTGALAPVQ